MIEKREKQPRWTYAVLSVGDVWMPLAGKFALGEGNPLYLYFS